METMENEIGRELKASELVVETVVILGKEGRPMVTMWVLTVGSDFVEFYAGMTRMHFIAKRNPDDTLEDDSKMAIRVYEYLGKE